MIIVIFSLSVAQFSILYNNKPYYHFTSMSMLLILNGIYMWTNTVLIVAKVKFIDFK
jgi:hypothetical protein